MRKKIIALGYYSRKYCINIDVLELATEAIKSSENNAVSGVTVPQASSLIT